MGTCEPIRIYVELTLRVPGKHFFQAFRKQSSLVDGTPQMLNLYPSAFR